ESEIPEGVQRRMALLGPIGRVTTTRARLPEVVATVWDELGLGQVCGGGDPGAGVGAVLTWTEHRVALLAQRFGPELYDKCLLGATRCSRYSLEFCGVTDQQCVAFSALQTAPMTRLSRAVSTTSCVTRVKALMSTTRAICVSRRWSKRKLPPVIRIMAANTASSVHPSSGKTTPAGRHLWTRRA